MHMMSGSATFFHNVTECFGLDEESTSFYFWWNKGVRSAINFIQVILSNATGDGLLKNLQANPSFTQIEADDFYSQVNGSKLFEECICNTSAIKFVGNVSQGLLNDTQAVDCLPEYSDIPLRSFIAVGAIVFIISASVFYLSCLKKSPANQRKNDEGNELVTLHPKGSNDDYLFVQLTAR